SAWAEAEGEKGQMTRTWYSLPGDNLFAVAGVWRPTAEWGEAYAMVMVDGCQQMSDVHDRMPVILPRESWKVWTDSVPEIAFGICEVWAGQLLVDHTQERWAGKKG
ncbi:MAG: SOS response-associated peptidase family protein, partial [Novosphingobium sp.]